MKKELQEMSIAELQLLFMTDTKRFIEALDDGTPINLLQPMRERIKEIGNLLDEKKSMYNYPDRSADATKAIAKMQ